MARTVTWVEPVFYIAYDNLTGEIVSIGDPKKGYPSFETTFNIVEKFLNGIASINDYKVFKEDAGLVIRKTANPHVVFKSFPVAIKDSDYPKVVITRSISKQLWYVETNTADPVFVFVCLGNDKRNYIRTLAITKNSEHPFMYDTEGLEVSLYVAEKNSEIKYQDESN